MLVRMFRPHQLLSREAFSQLALDYTTFGMGVCRASPRHVRSRAQPGVRYHVLCELPKLIAGEEMEFWNTIVD